MLLVCPKIIFFSQQKQKKITYFTSVWPDDIILVGSVRYISFLSYFLFAWAHIPPPFSQKGYRDWKGFQGYEDTIVCTYHCWGPFYGGRKRAPPHFKVGKKYPKIVFFLPELGAFGKFSVLYGFTMYGNSRSGKGLYSSILGGI